MVGSYPADPENARKQVDLSSFGKILVLGAGKATAPMARAFKILLGERISEGVIAVKYGHTEPLKRIEMIECGHPQPDENGVEAATRIMRLANQADAGTLVITLISGGGSALLPMPLHCDIGGRSVEQSLSDKNRLLPGHCSNAGLISPNMQGSL